MAYSLCIQAYKLGKRITRNNPPNIVIEPGWWSIAQLKEQYKFKSKEFDHGYLDYYFDITKKQLLTILNLNKIRSRKVKKASQNVLDKLEWLLKHFDEYKRVRILIFEWESGLGD